MALDDARTGQLGQSVADPRPSQLAMLDYPPEEEREAVDLVLKQMEIVVALWAPEAK